MATQGEVLLSPLPPAGRGHSQEVVQTELVENTVEELHARGGERRKTLCGRHT